jgi:hypothetical protein
MNTADILQWLEAESAAAEKQGLKVSATILAETAEKLRAEVRKRNAANIAALDKKQT